MILSANDPRSPPFELVHGSLAARVHRQRRRERTSLSDADRQFEFVLFARADLGGVRLKHVQVFLFVQRHVNKGV